MALRPTPLTVRRRNLWNEGLEGSDETQLLLDNAGPRGNAPHPSPSSSLSSECSVRSESVSWYGLQRVFGRGERGKKKYGLRLTHMLFGKPQCTNVKCKNCKEYEKVKKGFQNVEDFMCAK